MASRVRSWAAPVRRAVYERAGGRCAFVDAGGRRGESRSRLEFHHRHPHGHGGDRTPGNISLLCRSHNRYLAEIDYGKTAIGRHRRRRRVSDRSDRCQANRACGQDGRPGAGGEDLTTDAGPSPTA